MNYLANLDHFDNLFDLFFDRKKVAPQKRALVPAMNAVSNDKEVQLSFELPGFSKEDISINIEENRLHVAAEKKSSSEDKKEEDGQTWIRREISTGKFERVLSLPENIKVDDISAENKDGILTITLPKALKEEKILKIPVKG